MTGIVDIEYGIPVYPKPKDQAWPDWVYEQTMFNLWAGIKSEEERQKLLDEINLYEENDEFEVVFSISLSRRDNIKSLCDMRTKILLEFDRVEFYEDDVVVKIKKNELIKKIDWIKEHFKAIEVNNKRYNIWI